MSLPDVPVPLQNQRGFYVATIILLLFAVVITFNQKRHEGAVAIACVKGGDVQLHILEARGWFIASLTNIIFAILSCGFAVWRREKHHWVWIPIAVLLAFYVGLQLMMV